MNKVAVVTGASSGIGKAFTEKLLFVGYKVYGVCKSHVSGVSLGATGIQADLTKLNSFEKISAAIREDKIDVLINNAGVCFEEVGLAFTEDSYLKLFDLNLKAPILLTQKLKNKLLDGIVVNISSASDRIVGEGYALYCSSKAAFSKYFEAVALEEKKIKFITILPSYVDTPLLRKLHPEKDFNWSEVLKPEEVANFVGEVIENKRELKSGAKVIVVNDALKEDLEYNEDLWGYNTTTKDLIKLG